MVAGARLALEAGWEVRGSDNALYPPASDMVASLGVPVSRSYAAHNLEWKPDVVVIGNVLSRGNPEVEAVLERRMNFMSLPEWLKDNVLRKRDPIVICGTHGKTTTTALTAHVLDNCSGPKPGYLIGGQPLGMAHSAHLGGKDSPFVIEGDEYDTAFFDKRAKFLHYLPKIAVVTSLEFDHGDIYRDLSEIETAFERLMRIIPQRGWLLACADNHAASLCQRAYSNTATYGFSESADWRGEQVDAPEGYQGLQVYKHGRPWVRIESPLSGRHNLQNVLAAVAVAGLRGINAQEAAAAVRTFRGVKRRMEVFLERGDVTFVDDFAHHPTAIGETIQAAHQRWPHARVHVMLEPRSNTLVTRRFQSELAAALGHADTVMVGPIYRGKSIPESERLDREGLCEALAGNGIPAKKANTLDRLASYANRIGEPGDVVLLLSNGAFLGLRQRLIADQQESAA